MRPTAKHFHYTACGLDNVWLANGFKVRVTRHGNAVAVNDVDGLHHLIAQTLIDKPGRLTGKEFRFLSTQLGLSQEALGVMLDFSENAVSLWERKRCTN
jgi:DNA-binding transcriptional regulator YiaG